jgi:hypothetical protein
MTVGRRHQKLRENTWLDPLMRLEIMSQWQKKKIVLLPPSVVHSAGPFDRVWEDAAMRKRWRKQVVSQ